LNTSDFSSFLLQAQNAHPDVLALTDTGANLVNAVKQAREFGLDQAEMRLASFLMQISELHAIGLADAKGMLLATAFDWNMNEQTRDFGKRFFEKGHRMPTMVQAGLYSAITHYLKAVQASGETTGKAVIDEMKKLPVHDFFAPDGIVRADGVLIHDFYLAQVKAPDESTEPWDYLKIVATIPGSEAFRPLAESKCPLAKQAPQQVE
jgi:branched-chain amino acid transport system substrate-binding protein